MGMVEGYSDLRGYWPSICERFGVCMVGNGGISVMRDGRYHGK